MDHFGEGSLASPVPAMTGITQPSAQPGAEPTRRSTPMRKFCGSFAREEGQTMAEYGVVLTVITIASLGALGYLSTSILKRILTVAGFIS
jgi:Flp pilus assembly pilin Flp